VAQRLSADGFQLPSVDLDESILRGHGRRHRQRRTGKALAVGSDVSNEEQVAAAFARIESELGAPTRADHTTPGVIRDNAALQDDDRTTGTPS